MARITAILNTIRAALEEHRAPELNLVSRRITPPTESGGGERRAEAESGERKSETQRGDWNTWAYCNTPSKDANRYCNTCERDKVREAETLPPKYI